MGCQSAKITLNGVENLSIGNRWQTPKSGGHLNLMGGFKWLTQGVGAGNSGAMGRVAFVTHKVRYATPTGVSVPSSLNKAHGPRGALSGLAGNHA